MEYLNSLEQLSIIEGAYLAGFEPSTDDITGTDLFIEAEAYLYNSLRF